MTDTQMIILVAMPLFGIATNVALFLYVAGRVDKLSTEVGTLSVRVTGLEGRIDNLSDRVTRLEEHGPKLVTA